MGEKIIRAKANEWRVAISRERHWIVNPNF
jgi:hypothetical protein